MHVRDPLPRSSEEAAGLTDGTFFCRFLADVGQLSVSLPPEHLCWRAVPWQLASLALGP